MLKFGNLTALQTLAPATVTAKATSVVNGSTGTTTVTLTNTSTTPTVAFFLRADVRYGNAAGVPNAGDNEILPITWSDNDVTIWPGESVTLTGTYNATTLQADGYVPVVSVYGSNVATFDVAAPL
jgi:exo-1,4-beta-D-glucosaminidase